MSRFSVVTALVFAGMYFLSLMLGLGFLLAYPVYMLFTSGLASFVVWAFVCWPLLATIDVRVSWK